MEDFIKKYSSKEQSYIDLFLAYRKEEGTRSLSKLFYYLETTLLNKINNYVKDIDHSKEILQKSWIRLEIIKHEYDPEISSFTSWFFNKIIFGKIKQHLRDKQNSLLVILDNNPLSDDEDGEGFTPVSPELSPDGIIMSIEERRRIHEAIFRLDEDYQDVIILHHFGGMGFERIAAIFNLPHATIRTWHTRAKKELEKILIKKLGLMKRTQS